MSIFTKLFDKFLHRGKYADKEIKIENPKISAYEHEQNKRRNWRRHIARLSKKSRKYNYLHS